MHIKLSFLIFKKKKWICEYKTSVFLSNNMKLSWRDCLFDIYRTTRNKIHEKGKHYLYTEKKKNGVRCLRFTFTLYILWKVNLTSSKYIKIYTNNNRVIDKKKIVYISPLTLKIQKKKLFQNKRKFLHWLTMYATTGSYGVINGISGLF